LDTPEVKVTLDHKAITEVKVTLDHRDILAVRATLDTPAAKVILVAKANREPRVQVLLS
jgi:hypothetical protein